MSNNKLTIPRTEYSVCCSTGQVRLDIRSKDSTKTRVGRIEDDYH